MLGDKGLADGADDTLRTPFKQGTVDSYCRGQPDNRKREIRAHANAYNAQLSQRRCHVEQIIGDISQVELWPGHWIKDVTF